MTLPPASVHRPWPSLEEAGAMQGTGRGLVGLENPSVAEASNGLQAVAGSHIQAERTCQNLTEGPQLCGSGALP